MTWFVSTYVEFNPDTGKVISITSHPETKNYIEVDYDKVKDICDGKETTKFYEVQFNTTSLMYEFVNVYDKKGFQYNVNNSIYKVPNTNNADIILHKNYKNKQWELKFGELFAKTLKDNDVTLQTVKTFSVCKKDDPFTMQRTLTFNLSSNNLALQFTKDDAIMEVYDIYTNKLFNSYGVVNET